MPGTRQEIREHWSALLSGALVGSGKLAQAVYDHHVGDFQGQSPAVVVGAGGAEPALFTRQKNRPVSWLDVFVFVLYALPDGTWTEENADDRLDAIWEVVAGLVESRQKTAYWDAIDYEGRSETGYVPVGGALYRRELIALKFS